MNILPAKRDLLRIFCIFILLTPAFPAPAQELQTQYTFQGNTFKSLTAAEQFMWDHTWDTTLGILDPTAKWLQRLGWLPGTGSNFNYGFVPVDYTNVGGYQSYMGGFTNLSMCPGDCPIIDQYGNNFCTPNIYTFCRSDTPIINSTLQGYSRTGCPATLNSGPSYSPILNVAGYPNPTQFALIDPTHASGWLHYRGDYSFTGYFYGCAFPTTENRVVYAYSLADCPVGYDLITYLGSSLISGCKNDLAVKIVETGAITPEPTMQCSAGNPCHPTTGDKSLVETDFQSPTLTFSRSYHSLTPYEDYAAMGRGWTHEYSQRILSDNGAAIPTKKLLDGKGNVEQFKCTNSPACSVYRSVSKPGHVLLPITGGWLYRSPDGLQQTFDSEGKLDAIERLSGDYVFLTVAYNSNKKVSSATDQFGRRLQFAYDANGMLTTLTLPAGDVIRYEYAHPAGIATQATERQNLVKVIREDLKTRLYHYEDKNPDTTPRNVYLLTGITDENGMRFATYAYDDRARVTSSEHTNGAGRVTLNYTQRPGESHNWSITKVTQPLGEVVTYDMDATVFRKPTSIEDSEGNFSITYDPTTNWRSSKTDREQNQTSYVYDSLHEIRRTEAVGTADARVIETDWNTTINRIAERREPGKKTNYTYNIRGQVLTRTEKDSSTLATRAWTYTYFEPPSLGALVGRLQTVNGPRTDVSDITTFEYYTSNAANGDYVTGDSKAMVNALGHRSDFLRYDGNGRPLQVRDANNALTVLTYHPRGWINTRTTAAKTTSFGYDAVGNVTRVTQADGSFIDYEYDGAHRLTAIADNFDNRVDYTLDADGNRTSEKTYDDNGALRRKLNRVYDQLSRLSTLVDGNNESTLLGYDGNGNRTDSEDANLNTTTIEYDPLNRLTTTIDALLGNTLMDYDARDNLVSVTDPRGNVTEYTYDGLDNQLYLDSPDTGGSAFEYDTAGNRKASTDARGVRTDFTYDALNRLTAVSYPGTSLDVSFTYDVGTNGKGRLTGMADAVGSSTYAYDMRGNLLTETRAISGTQYVTSYSYNEADRLTRTTYPSGMVINYALDAAGRITAVNQTLNSVSSNIVSNVAYEPFGPVAQFTYGNGLVFNASFDQDYELDLLQSGSGLNWAFAHDPVGNILAIDDRQGTQYDQVLSYDDLYRLKTAQGSYGTESLTYDANGNRTQYLSGAVNDSYSYESQSNRLATQSGWTFSHDASGNRTQKLNSAGLGQLFSYADNNRLTQAKLRASSGDTVVGDYQYDGKGQRVSKTTAAGTSHFIYGLNGELIGEYKNTGELVSEFIYLNGQPVAVYATQTETLPPTPPIDLIVDNDGSGTSSTGSWAVKTNAKDYGANYREGDTTDTYRWTPSPISGIFEVYAWWVANSKYSKVANYAISHNGASDVVVKGHDRNGGAWQLLGTFVFNGSGTEYVQLHAADGKKISADAIRFKQLGGGGGGIITTVATYFTHTDHLGTPRRVSNDVQTVIWRWDSRPFGDSVPNEDPDGNAKAFVMNLRFPGQYFDAEAGLNYNYFRTYDPSVGRYIESDPIGLNGGMNTYLYADGSPPTRTDPFGLETFMCMKPLRALGGKGARSGWDVWGNPFYHQYLCIYNAQSGYTCGGQDNRGQKWYDPINGPGKPSDDKYDPQTCEQKEPDNNCIEQCLLEKFAGPRPRYGIPFGTDCQEWSDDALKDCQKQCKKK